MRGLLALGLLAAGAIWLLLARHEGSNAMPAPAAPTPTPGASGPRIVTAAPPAADPGPAVAVDQLALPDGTSVPALNGARGAPPLQQFWGQRPWSPIVRVERSDLGIDWYVHADGTRSTTEMKWRQDLGRLDAMTRVAQPVDRTLPPALPTDR